MQDNVTQPYECPICGFAAETQEELNMHFQEKADDEEHQEGGIFPKKEVIEEDSVGAPVGTPGHPGIDEGTE